MAKVVVGMFDNMEYARDAVNELVDNGIDRNAISLIAGDERGEMRRYVGQENTGSEVAESAAGGAGIGAIMGGLGGLLVGLGALAIPGFGPVIAAGPIVSALTGAGVGAAAGAVTGGLLGALVEMGIPDERAQVYSDGIRHGNILVTARVDDAMANTAVSILNRHHPIDVDRKSSEWRQSSQQSSTTTTGAAATTGGYTGGTQRNFGMERGEDISGTGANTRRDYDLDPTDGDATIPVVEEDLTVGKREVDTGSVNVRTTTHETPVEKDVNLRQEHIDVERRPVDRPATPEDFDRLGNQSFEVRATSEEPVVEKRARVVEEVDIHKDVDQRQETIRDNVRRTDVDVDRSGDMSSRDMGTHDMGAHDMGAHDMEHDMSTHEHDKYDETGRVPDEIANPYRTNYPRGYEDDTPYYEIGTRMRADARYQGRAWEDIEPDVRREWEANHSDTPWEDFKESVRKGWDSITGKDEY